MIGAAGAAMYRLNDGLQDLKDQGSCGIFGAVGLMPDSGISGRPWEFLYLLAADKPDFDCNSLIRADFVSLHKSILIRLHISGRNSTKASNAAAWSLYLHGYSLGG